MSLADYQQLVKSMVPADDTLLTDVDRNNAINLALLRYSTDVPLELVRDVGWLVSGFIGPLPDEWVDGSIVRSAEYPIGRSPPAQLNVALYTDEGGVLLLADTELPAGAEVRLTFATPHRLDETTDTVPLGNREALASYAAHALCRQLAARFSSERESSIAADGSNTESRARNFAARAKEYRSAYFVGIGQVDPYAPGNAGASSGVVAAATVGSWPGRNRYSLTRWSRP